MSHIQLSELVEAFDYAVDSGACFRGSGITTRSSTTLMKAARMSVPPISGGYSIIVAPKRCKKR